MFSLSHDNMKKHEVETIVDCLTFHIKLNVGFKNQLGYTVSMLDLIGDDV